MALLATLFMVVTILISMGFARSCFMTMSARLRALLAGRFFLKYMFMNFHEDMSSVNSTCVSVESGTALRFLHSFAHVLSRV